MADTSAALSTSGAVEAPDHDVRAVLAITPFRRLWLALGLSSFGDWLGLLATTALAGALPQTPAAKLLAVSGVFILRLAPAVLFGPLAGVVADRLPRRWTLVYGDVLRFLIFCTIPIVGTLWWLYVAIVLVEIVGLFWMPAKDATVPNLVPRRRLEAANQLSLIVTYGSAPVAALVFAGLTLVSGVIDGVVPQLADNPTYLALYVNALTFLVSAMVIWRLDFPAARSASARQESILRTAMAGWTFIGRTPLVRGLVLGMLGAFAAGGFVIGLAQAYVGDLRAGSPGYGMLFAAVFVGMAAGMWLAPRLLAGFPRRRMFGLSIGAAGVWLVLLSLVPNIVLAVFFVSGLGACAGAAWVTGYTLLGLEVGDDVRGRTFAFVQSMVRVVLITVLALAPVVAAGFSKVLDLPHTVGLTDQVSLTYTGSMATFLLAGAAAIVVGVLAYRQMDDRPGVSLASDLVAAVRQRHLHHAPARRDAHLGCFVAFEGGDGAGKSTQVRLLGEWLGEHGYTPVLTHEPGATPTGQRLREVLLHGDDLSPRAEALLFAADRAHHVETVVRPALEAGHVVVTDRFMDSSVAYQGSGRDLGTTEVAQLSRWATQGLLPDLTVVLDIDPGAGRTRRADEHDRLESEPDDFHARVRERFLDLAARAPSRYLVVDAELGPQEVHRQVVERLRPLLPESATRRAAREQREALAEAARAEQEAQLAAAREEAAREAAHRARIAAQVQAERQARRAAAHAEREAAQAQAAADRRAAQERANLERREAELEVAREAERERARARAAQIAEQERTAAAPAGSAPTAPLPITPPVPAAPAASTPSASAPTAPLPAVPPAPTSREADTQGHQADEATAPLPLDDEIFRLGRRERR